MKKMSYLIVCVALCACSDHRYEEIDMAYVKDCNERGGRVERIEYSSTLQCVRAQQKEDAK